MLIYYNFLYNKIIDLIIEKSLKFSKRDCFVRSPAKGGSRGGKQGPGAPAIYIYIIR
jgi:hypothetical protein